MVRYLGYLLIGVMAIALAGGVGLILFGGMAERLATPGTVRLVAFDQVIGVGGRVRIRAFLEDMDYQRPIPQFWLMARLPDGWIRPLSTNGRGLADSARYTALKAGVFDYTVAYPETHPRLDIVAHGSIWVLPPDERVLWIDAAALISPEARGEVAPEAVAAVKTLAAARQPVYLVACKSEQYAAVRRQLEACDVPRGPAVWFWGANDELSQFKQLMQASPNMDGAVLCHEELVKAAAALHVPILQVPYAGKAEAPAENVVTWREVIDKGLPSREALPKAGDTK
jgi:hypothetical protein